MAAFVSARVDRDPVAPQLSDYLVANGFSLRREREVPCPAFHGVLLVPLGPTVCARSPSNQLILILPVKLRRHFVLCRMFHAIQRRSPMVQPPALAGQSSPEYGPQ